MDIQETQDNEVSKQSEIVALLTWFATLFIWLAIAIKWDSLIYFLFVPALIVLRKNENDSFIQSHTKENLNFCLNLYVFTIAYLVIMAQGGFLSLIPSYAYTLFKILCGLIFFMGAVKATNAKEIRVPFMLRFLK
jgi:uncharacterized Tic20 family protein